MIDMLTRHEIQVLRRAGHSHIEAAKLAGVSLGSVRRVEREPDVTQSDSGQERERRGIGRPAKAEPFRALVMELLAKGPELLSLEILRRAQLAGYTGGKTALYDLVNAVRPTTVRPLVRFEGLPGGVSQHDFGQVDVRFLDGTHARPFLCVALEIFALGRGHDRARRVRRDAGAGAGRSLRGHRGHFALGGLRSAHDDRLEVEQGRTGDRMECPLRGRGPRSRVGHRTLLARPLIRQLTLYRDLIDRKTGDPL